jgi:hypothetical protein
MGVPCAYGKGRRGRRPQVIDRATAHRPITISPSITTTTITRLRRENSDNATRDNFNAIVSNFSLADTYWPAFQQTARTASPRGVMCSYVRM